MIVVYLLLLQWVLMVGPLVVLFFPAFREMVWGLVASFASFLLRLGGWPGDAFFDPQPPVPDVYKVGPPTYVPDSHEPDCLRLGSVLWFRP